MKKGAKKFIDKKPVKMAAYPGSYLDKMAVGTFVIFRPKNQVMKRYIENVFIGFVDARPYIDKDKGISHVIKSLSFRLIPMSISIFDFEKTNLDSDFADSEKSPFIFCKEDLDYFLVIDKQFSELSPIVGKPDLFS